MAKGKKAKVRRRFEREKSRKERHMAKLVLQKEVSGGTSAPARHQ